MEFAPYPDRGIHKLKKAEEVYDAILLDLNYPDRKISFDEGLDVILPNFLKVTNGESPIIIVTSDHRLQTHQRALDNGARLLLRKSLYREGSSAKEWEDAIRQVVEYQSDKRGNKGKKPAQSQSVVANTQSDGFVTNSPSVEAIKEKLKKVASFPNYIPVLLLGETGVGKEVAASYLHLMKKGKGQYTAINLSALSEETFEAELFGTVKGIYTDATDRNGLLEAAKGGTLLLDEIGEASENIQVKLLRVIDDRSFRKVGGTQSIDLDVQLVFATNKNLEEAVTKGHMRQDFYERIQPVTINIPPLRERKEDIRPLVEFFLKNEKVCPPQTSFYAKSIVDCFPDEVIAYMERYSWPGNVRELRGLLQSMVIEASLNGDMKFGKHHLPKRVFFKAAPGDGEAKGADNANWSLDKRTAYNEMENIEKAIIDAGGRKEDAAQKLGIKNADALRYRVKEKFYLDYPDFFDYFPSVCKAYKLAAGYEKALNIFICYARNDAEVLAELKKHLKSLDGKYPLRVWTDNEIVPGEEWNKKIQKRLETADVFVLLLSPSFLASEYILNVELEKAFERHETGKVTIVPVVSKACNWKSNNQLSSLQALPGNGDAVSKYPDTDAAYVEVVTGIERTIKNIYEDKVD